MCALLKGYREDGVGELSRCKIRETERSEINSSQGEVTRSRNFRVAGGTIQSPIPESKLLKEAESVPKLAKRACSSFVTNAAATINLINDASRAVYMPVMLQWTKKQKEGR